MHVSVSCHDTPLTVDNFTFMRQAIGVEEGETIRSAKSGSGRPVFGKILSPHSAKLRKKIGRPPKKKDNYFGDESVHDDNDGHYDKPEIVIERDDYMSHIMASAVDGDGEKATAQNTEVVYPSKEAVIVSPSSKKFKPTARKSTTQKQFRM